MFRSYRQLEHSDCGLTCIRMIARHYGRKVPVRYMHEVSDMTRLGMSIKDISESCKAVGLNSAAVRIGTEHMHGMPLPAILYWEQKHFVVLYKINARRKRYYIADPAVGKLSCSEAELCKYWLSEGDDKGIAIVAEPDETFLQRKYEPDRWLMKFARYIGGYIGKYRKSLAFTLLLTLLIMGADFIVPLLLKRTVDEGIALKDIGLIGALLLGQLAITIGSLVATNGMNLVLTRTGLRANLDMMGNFIERLARFPIAFFDRRVSSDMIQKINDHARIKDFLLSFPNTIIITLLSLIVFSVLLCHYSPLIFGVFVVFSLLEIIWDALFLPRKKSLDYAYFHHSSENYNHANELTTGMADLKINNAEKQRISKWRTTQQALNRVSMRTAMTNMAQGGGHSLLSRFKELAVTGLSAILVVNGDMTFGIMITLGYITGRLAQPFNSISDSINRLQQSLLSYERVDDVVNSGAEETGDKKFTSPEIEIKDVWFKYPGSSSPYVIQDFTLDIRPGSVTALVGESGCGKSTLIKLMLGFYQSHRGSLRLSGHDISEIDHSDWLAHCGVVMQEAKIFTGSILDNIALSDFKPDREKCLRLLEVVDLSDFVRRLPMGIDTRIGTTGVELSGVQKQRLMIARALYKEPRLLFLDEATSSLDANNERSIVERIQSMTGDTTIIIAAHRLSTVQNADRIIYIKDGRIVEAGTHEELTDRKGYYWQLVKNQLQLSV